MGRRLLGVLVERRDDTECTLREDSESKLVFSDGMRKRSEEEETEQAKMEKEKSVRS